jgi:hypothetical protein
MSCFLVTIAAYVKLAAADLLPLGHAAASLFLLRAGAALFLLSRVVSALSLLPRNGGELPGAVRERFIVQGPDP